MTTSGRGRRWGVGPCATVARGSDPDRDRASAACAGTGTRHGMGGGVPAWPAVEGRSDRTTTSGRGWRWGAGPCGTVAWGADPDRNRASAACAGTGKRRGTGRGVPARRVVGGRRGRTTTSGRGWRWGAGPCGTVAWGADPDRRRAAAARAGTVIGTGKRHGTGGGVPAWPVVGGRRGRTTTSRWRTGAGPRRVGPWRAAPRRVGLCRAGSDRDRGPAAGAGAGPGAGIGVGRRGGTGQRGPGRPTVGTGSGRTMTSGRTSGRTSGPAGGRGPRRGLDFAASRRGRYWFSPVRHRVLFLCGANPAMGAVAAGHPGGEPEPVGRPRATGLSASAGGAGSAGSGCRSRRGKTDTVSGRWRGGGGPRRRSAPGGRGLPGCVRRRGGAASGRSGTDPPRR